MGDPLRLVLGTLTAVPVAPPGSLTAPVAGRAMLLAPMAGLVPGLAGALAVLVGLRCGLSTPVLAVTGIGLFALTTRGLHLDGLADTADGLAASYDRERALAVMRRGDTGPAGLAAVVLTLLLQAALLAQVLEAALRQLPDGLGGQLRAAAVLPAVAVGARLAITALCLRGVPAARPDGLGAVVAGSVPPLPLLAVIGVVAAGCAGAGRIAGFSWSCGLLAVALVVLVAGLLGRRAGRRLGGITGDVLGAAVELATTAALLGFSVRF